jgi:hypothetical protein
LNPDDGASSLITFAPGDALSLLCTPPFSATSGHLWDVLPESNRAARRQFGGRMAWPDDRYRAERLGRAGELRLWRGLNH